MMANDSKQSRRLRTKLKPLYAAMLPLMVFGITGNVYALGVNVDDNIDDGSTTVLGSLNSVSFTAPAAGTDEVFTIADGDAVSVGGVSVLATTANGVGKLECLGDCTFFGDIGATGNRLGLLTGGLAGKKVNIQGSAGSVGDRFIDDIDFSGTGTIRIVKDLTVTNDIDFKNQAGILQIESDANITGNVTSTGGINGTVTFNSGTNSSISGTITAATINAGVAASTVTLTGAVTATNLELSSTGIVNLQTDSTIGNIDFNNKAGTVSLSDTVDITGNVISTGGTNGSLTFLGSGSVSGGITAATINAGVAASTVTLTGAVTATNLELSSTGIVNLQTDSTIGNIDFNNKAGTVSLSDTVDITGNVISTGGTNGSLTFLGSGSVSGGITAATINAGVAASTVTLTGAVTATNLELSSTGIVNLQTDSTIGNIDFNNKAGTVSLSDTVDITGNVISTGGTNGSLTFLGSGSVSGGITAATINAGVAASTVTLTGAVTTTNLNLSSTGTVQIGNGGTTGSISGNITNNGTVTFNRSDALTYGNVISGTGTFTQAGTGSTNLTGTNTYNGATTINAGTLFVNGSNSNSITTVNAGGTLGGSGTIGSVNVAGGTFAPGNSIGTTNVAGNIDFTGGGNYNVEVDAAGNTDKIIATGSATLTSGIVNVQAESGNYNVSTDYTILTAAGGLGGTTFSSVNSNLAFLTPTLTYDATNVFLNLTRNSVSFNSVATTPNQTAVSTLLGNNTTALQTIVNNVLTLSTASAQQTFDSLTGVQHTHGQVLTNKLSQQFLQLLFNRGSQNPNTALSFNTVQPFDPLQGHLLADNSNNWETAATDSGSLVGHQRGWWLQGFGGFGDIDTTTNASGADYDTQGLAFGVDTQWRDIVVGLAGSYASSDADTFGGSLEIDSFQAATYANWQRDAVYMNAVLGTGFHQTDASRTVVVGTTTSTATSDYDTYNVSAVVEGGKAISLSTATTLTPFASVEYIHSIRDNFTETGAGAANLSVNDEDQDSLRTKLGLRLSHDITIGQGTRVTPTASVAYVREMMDNVSRTEAAFTAVPTSTFRIDGSDLDRDRVQLSLGVTGQLNERTTLNVAYNGELADSDDNHSFSATIRLVW